MRLLSAGIAGFAAFAGASSATSGDVLPMPKFKGVEIQNLPIDSLQKLMTEGGLTSRDLVECYLARIEQTNNYTRSISEVNPDALAIATTLDTERRLHGRPRSPLHGIPFLVKDNFYTADAHNTSEGTLVLLGGRSTAGEATIVTKLRAAGGVLLGHATMSEAADHRALTSYASGYSSRTGQTRNPYNLTQSTAGSSSGSVVAVRINQAAVAVGTETYGSLVHPAAQLGLYTVKATPGLLSRRGVVTGSYYHDTPGPLARSVRDVAVMLDIMHGTDPLDNLTFQAVGKHPVDGYTAHLANKSALRGMKFGIPWDPYWSTNAHMNSPGIRQVYEQRIKELEEAGAQIYNITNSPFTGLANEYGAGQHTSIPPAYQHSLAFATLLAAGYAEWLRHWLFPKGDPRHGTLPTVADMAAWNTAHNASTGALGNNTWWQDPITGQSFYDAAAATNGTLGPAFWTAFGWSRTTARQAIDQAHVYLSENGTRMLELDGVLVPNGRAGGYSSACAPMASYAGYPVASVPVGQDGFATPFALGVYGRQYGEAKLVQVASAMEDLFQWNEAPRWHNADVRRDRPWDVPWPGYTCSKESLARRACTG
ncbi:amidase family protein [Apiospora aurea]|uniref:Amidase family protein n=1 Tax=Apiospora aurea TaxID=335848 RepID=A0ABR1QQ86_9PEZI